MKLWNNISKILKSFLIMVLALTGSGVALLGANRGDFNMATYGISVVVAALYILCTKRPMNPL